MTWRRGLFRLWLVATGAWWIFAFSVSRVGCRLLTDLERYPARCEYTDNSSALIGALFWPAVVFGLGWIVVWTATRFGATPSK